jgi:uncharacterized protein YndB with AHSA1/START domain
MRLIAADRKTAYDAFTDPGQMSIWFTTQAKADLRVGGSYENADGDSGEFRVLEPPSRVQFTWENAKHCPGTMVDVTFSETSEGQTIVRLEHSLLKSEADASDMRGGWSWALDSFKSYLETGQPISHEDWLNNQRDS